MKDVRAWILVLVFISFVAGVAAGRIMTDRAHGWQREEGRLTDYERALAARFELSPERARALRGILEHYEQRVERIKDEHLSAYRSAIEPELRELSLEYNALIRDKVLPPAQRRRFDDYAQLRPNQ